MKVPDFVRRWVAGVVDDALDVLDFADYGAFSDLGERVDVLEGSDLESWVENLGEQVGRLESSVDLDELSEMSAGLEVRVENCETEGALDRVRLEELERRYLALEYAVGVFAGTGDAAALFEHVRQAAENGGQS
jgi:hypothetical protein